MLGSRVSLQDVARKREGSRWRYKPRTRGPARPAALKDYNAILPVMASRWESSGSDGSGKSWACGVNRSRSSRRQQTHAIRCPVAENLLGQQFEATAPGEIWLSDITYIPTEEGWLYCAAHKDLFNGEIVGYALGSRITKNLVKQSLFQAVRAKRPAQGLIHHSDRGSQYCAHDYRKLLDPAPHEGFHEQKG